LRCRIRPTGCVVEDFWDSISADESSVAGFSWYEAKSPGLGDEFLRTFYAPVISPAIPLRSPISILTSLLYFVNINI
jgi:hypothetical protein